MVKNKFRKSISIILTLALANTMMPCAAANIVPVNGGSVAVPPSAPVSSIESKNPSGDFSIQAMKSKISDIINPQKSQSVRRETYSGSCGTNVSWSLDTGTGVLTISGTGEMTSLSLNGPWYNYRDSIKSVTIENGVTSIGGFAFFSCSSLEKVSFSGKKEPTNGGGVFDGCSKLTKVNVPYNYENDIFCDIPVEKAANPNGSGLSGGAIAGIVIGSLAAVVAAVVGTILFLNHGVGLSFGAQGASNSVELQGSAKA